MHPRIKTIVNNFWKPSWWRDRALPFAVDRVNRAYYNHRDNDGTYVVAEAWDNLVVLDACRYDVFADVSSLEYDLQSRISRGSSSLEFVEENFAGRNLDDVVYVTANPFVDRIASDVFHDIVSVWDFGWDEQLCTVPPETMVTETLDAAERYPDKRLISHFMQPHHPFIGEFGRSNIQGQTGFTNTRSETKGQQKETHTRVWYHLLRNGELSAEVAWQAYRENLELVMPHIEKLLDELPNQTVVTADHGNLFDERIGVIPQRMSGHPTGIHAEKLVKVPWLVVDGPRREVQATSTSGTTEHEKAQIEQRLADLGYQ
jgi:hypothetical protein